MVRSLDQIARGRIRRSPLVRDLERRRFAVSALEEGKTC